MKSFLHFEMFYDGKAFPIFENVFMKGNVPEVYKAYICM